MILTPGEINYIEENTILYEVGETTQTISLLMQGEVEQHNFYSAKGIHSGQFLDIQGLIDGKHYHTFQAKTDVALKVFEANSIKSLVEMLMKDKELHESIIVELSNFIVQQVEYYQALYTQTNNLYQSIVTIKKHYVQHCERMEHKAMPIPIGKEIEDFTLVDQIFYNDTLLFKEISENPEKAYFYLYEDKNKLFTTQLTTIINCYKQYLKLKSLAQRLSTVLLNKKELSLFTAITELIEYSNTIHIENTSLLRLLDTMCSLTKSIQDKIYAVANVNLHIDEEYITICLSRANNIQEVKMQGPHPLSQPKNTLRNLMEYANFENDKQTAFMDAINRFIALGDKNSSNERQLFRQISDLYYELYESVFFKTLQDEQQYVMVDLFLNFGFLDERLLHEEQITKLLEIEALEENGPCKIYRMKDWLTCIYKGIEPPSKNEYDEDYHDQIRQKVRLENLTKPQEMSLLNNGEQKVKFEIHNLLKYNNRLINGSLTAFVPMLYKEDFMNNIEKLVVTTNKFNEALSSIMAIDYSIFYRELIYADETSKIMKEFIQKEIFPVILLFPVNGYNGIMWQEITRKRSDSAGRFLLPSLTSINLREMLLKVLGRFRWELCKQQQGYSWNNSRVPSLTSEYCDYVQFYKTNKELSPEKKELLKMQISKYRNNNREIFVSDYIQWIEYESTGALRLNNAARRILSTYCPFSKEIRDVLVKRPMFDKAMFKFNHVRNKKIKELHNRYTAITNNGGQLTQELLNTKRFYNEL